MSSLPQEYLDDNVGLVYAIIRRRLRRAMARSERRNQEAYEERVQQCAAYAVETYAAACDRENPATESACRRLLVGCSRNATRRKFNRAVGSPPPNPGYIDAMNRRTIERLPAHGTDEEVLMHRTRREMQPRIPDRHYLVRGDEGRILLEDVPDHDHVDAPDEDEEKRVALLLNLLPVRVRRTVVAVMDSENKRQREIAAELGISERTVRYHLQSASDVLAPYALAVAQAS